MFGAGSQVTYGNTPVIHKWFGDLCSPTGILNMCLDTVMFDD